VADLDYFELIKEEKRLAKSEAPRPFRLAVLGDCATQSVVKMLRALLARAGVQADIWEAGFDTIETEAFNPASELYAFEPAAVVIFSSLGAFRQRFYHAGTDKAAFADGAIPVKYKELMALAVALTTQCPYCLEIHKGKALKAGATPEEIAETTFVAAAIRAGGAITHGTHLVD